MADRTARLDQHRWPPAPCLLADALRLAAAAMTAARPRAQRLLLEEARRLADPHIAAGDGGQG